MQMNLPMLHVYEGPRFVSPEVVAGITTYREAVRSCWDLRTRRNLTKRALAESVGAYASHVSDYFSLDAAKRELPAKFIASVEVECGNRVITQWLSARAGVTLMEQFMEHRRMA